MTATTSGATAVLAVVYDLRAGGWDQAVRHRRTWGVLYTHAYPLGPDHIVLEFHPAPGERWRRWEQERLRWLIQEMR